MIFEGSEKKAEIVIANNNLFEKDQTYWASIVKKCEAKIISAINTDEIRAFLLSESSLFVWKNRVLLITCGTTTLVHAVEKITQDFGIDNIQNLIFQRKNEYCGQMQKTNFFDDKKLLDQIHSGKGLRLGSFDEHHLFLYHLNRPYSPDQDDETCEVLTYGLNQEAINFFTQKDLSANEIRNFFRFDHFFPEFILNDFVFEPFGYSINGIFKDDYFTIHITPEHCHSYVSFESSLPYQHIKEGFLTNFLEVLAPESFDIIRYSPETIQASTFDPYTVKKYINSQIECGYHVEFCHYYDSTKKNCQPIEV